MMQTDKEYAQALFLLAVEKDNVDGYWQALDTVQRLVLESPDYIEFLASPAIPLRERLRAIDEAFGTNMPEYIVSFLKLLCENGRIRTLKDCIGQFGQFVMEYANRTAARIFSAVPLSEAQKDAVCSKLETLTGKHIDPVYILDGSLIGGLRIEIEGRTYDGSVQHRLRDVKDVMIG